MEPFVEPASGCGELSAFVDGELEDRRTHMFRVHLQACASCRTNLAFAVALGDRLRGLTSGVPIPVDDALPFDSLCPICHMDSAPGPRADGDLYRCRQCGRLLVAVAYPDRFRARTFSQHLATVKVRQGRGRR